MLPALQNSGRAKWGSARADRILKPRVSDKNGISFAGSETLQMPIAATDFCLSRAERVWDVICAIWDLLRCTEICKSLEIEFSAVKEIFQQIFKVCWTAALFFLLPKLLSWDLGSAVCALVDWALGSLAVRGTPCPHGLRPMRCKICCGCEHGRLRGQCKECGGSSSFCEHGRQRYYCNCKECGGSSFCEHRRQRSQCKECGRSSFCEHGCPRDYCNCRVRWQQHLRAQAAVHHLHEGVQWQCHSQVQAAAWPL